MTRIHGKGRPRIVDPSVFGMMRPRRRCPACRGDLLRLGASRHHILPTAQGGDDVLANLMWLCGHGTKGCHAAWHASDRHTASQIRRYLEAERQDTLAYLYHRLPEVHKEAADWLDRRYPATP